MSAPHTIDMRRFTKDVQFIPGYDKTNETPNRGMHGMDIWFILKDKYTNTAMTLEVSTNWMYFPDGVGEFKSIQHIGWPDSWDGYPKGSGVASHTPFKIQSDDYGPKDCELLSTGKCYGMSGMGVSDIAFRRLVQSGHDAMWEYLADLWQDWVGQHIIHAT